MDLRKVYDSTQDPLDYAGSVSLILNQYFASQDREDYYGRLRDTESEFFSMFAFAPEELDRFTDAHNATHCILFNHWMNNIRDISRLSVDEKNKFFERVSYASFETPSKAFHEGRMNSEAVKTAFNKLVNRVNKTSSVSNMSQIDGFKASFRDPNTVRLLELLNWFSGEQENADVMNIKANYLLTGQRKDQRNSMFIAVVPNKINVMEFVNEYLKRCDKFNVPYDISIPYDKYSKRIVRINSTIPNLGKNLAIVEDIAEKNPKMIEKMEQPPVLCGKIKDWIGIGTFSAKAIERTTCGYTDKRANLIVDAIEETTKKYILENYKKQFTANGITEPLKKHLSAYTYDVYLHKVRELADTYFETMRRDRNSIEDAEEAVKQYFGFYRIDLDDSSYLRMVDKTIDAHTNSMLSTEFKKDYNSVPVVNHDLVKQSILPNLLFSTRKVSDRHINVNGLFSEVLKKLAIDITVSDPRFKGYVVREIKKSFKENGISEKSCFEDYAVDEMFRLSEEEEKANGVTIKSPEKTIPAPTVEDEIVKPITRKVDKEDR